jgi:hypothetical protein
LKSIAAALDVMFTLLQNNSCANVISRCFIALITLFLHCLFHSLHILFCISYSTHAMDYLTDFMGCFENYIARGTAEFTRVPDYCNALVAIARKCANHPPRLVRHVILPNPFQLPSLSLPQAAL